MDYLGKGHPAAPNLRSCSHVTGVAQQTPKTQACGTGLLSALPCSPMVDSPSGESQMLGREDMASTYHRVLQDMDCPLS